uniref:Uncharacterized protein n=1 Tax=Pyxicephalus adspersus TaxID=30357 RepID=A0AAV3B183_PYXAD|nr:TPA: hypothetical protein GDO54_007156 [Pyxicephalus adspersus]
MASDAGRKQFWKRNVSKVPGSIQHVYGAQHPPFDPVLHGTNVLAFTDDDLIEVLLPRLVSLQLLIFLFSIAVFCIKVELHEYCFPSILVWNQVKW